MARKFAFVIVLIVVVLAGLAALSNTPATPSITGNSRLVSRPNTAITATLSPVRGNLSYTCPSDSPCSRTGSSEWFVASQTGTTFVISLFGGAQITAVTDYNGEPVTFTIEGSAITFDREVGGQLLVSIVGPAGQNSGAYGAN